jgi:DNA-binding MarR family transcriptional regulator
MSDRVDARPAEERPRTPALGASLRRAWIGYQLRLDREMAAAGFADRGLPDGRVLRLCAGSDSLTASEIGRELGMTRQGAGKIVAGLRDRGYVTLGSSTSDGREKTVGLTPRALEYLEALKSATRRIERKLRKQLGDDVFESLRILLDAIDDGEELPRMRDYLRQAMRSGDLDGA